jgi:hypothetical protein
MTLPGYDPHLFAGLAYAALQYVGNLELPAYIGDFEILGLIGKC